MNKAEVIFRNPEDDNKIIMNFEETEEGNLEFDVKMDPPVKDETRKVDLSVILAEALITALNANQDE